MPNEDNIATNSDKSLNVKYRGKKIIWEVP